MRRQFALELHKQMTLDLDIVVITCDLGYGMFDQIREDYPQRFNNVGASEQAGMDIAVGLALSGKKVFIYSITPFLIYRAYETIKLYINHENIPIVMVGSGRDDDYIHDGISHDATGVEDVLKPLKNITCFYPEKKEQIKDIMTELVDGRHPYFISLKR